MVNTLELELESGYFNDAI